MFSVTIQMKATEEYFPLVLFATRWFVVLSPLFEILKCDHSSESNLAVLCSSAVSFQYFFCY